MFGALGGCASLAQDQGIGPINAVASATFGQEVIKIRSPGDVALIRSRVASLLANPLTAEAAVRIAILNNRGLQASLDELGVSEAQLSASVLPPSPTLGYAALTGVGAIGIDRQIAVDVLAILTLPSRKDIAETQFKAAQLKATSDLLRIARETERAYIRTVASSETVNFLSTARASAEVTAELAKKLGETGALNRLDQAREHALYAELSAQLAAARLAQGAEREAFTRLLGLWGNDIKYRLPALLKALPARPQTNDSVEREAVLHRVDLAMQRVEVEAQAKLLGLTEAARFVDVLEVSARGARQDELLNVNGNSISDNLRTRGYDIQFKIPIFDLNETRIRSEREAYMQRVNRLIEKAVQVRSEARVAYVGYRGRYDIAHYYRDRVAPLHRIIADEGMLHYNGMLLDLFQLLADTRANVTSTIAGINALRDFWLANVDFKAALLGGSSIGGRSPTTVPDIAGNVTD